MEKKTEDAIIIYLKDIAKSLRIISGRESDSTIIKKKDESYISKYFAKSE